MKKMFLVVISVCLFVAGFGHVRAEKISYNHLDNVYFNLTVNGKFESHQVTMFILDGKIAYCIEPGVDINTKEYDSYKDWSKTNLPVDKQSYLEKIGYYGYEYPGHKTDKYYIATQELIWKAVDSNVDIRWTTAENNGGSIINVETEKKEILRLVNESGFEPSFIDDTITGEIGSELVLEDTHGVLNKYEVGSSKYHKVSINANSLKINFNENEVPMEEITLKKKRYDSQTLLVYVKADSQKLATLRISSSEILNLKLQNKKKPEEIVRVPSTGEENTVKRFGVVLGHSYNAYRFN